MRAVWISELKHQPEHTLSGVTHHHLVHVVRIEVGEELLLLNGEGLKVFSQVKSISKKEVILSTLKIELTERAFEMDLAVGIPKRDALELSLKEATELGFRKIYLIRAAYSQMKVPELDRMRKILISALEQSNSAFLPEIIEANWTDIVWDSYGLKLLMDSQSSGGGRIIDDLVRPTLLVVGPEGGFDSAELSYLHERPGLEVLNLPTPILRTPTAVATGGGCLLQRLIDRR